GGIAEAGQAKPAPLALAGGRSGHHAIGFQQPRGDRHRGAAEKPPGKRNSSQNSARDQHRQKQNRRDQRRAGGLRLYLRQALSVWRLLYNQCEFSQYTAVARPASERAAASIAPSDPGKKLPA